MGLPILMLMLLQAPAPVETRVIEPRDAPVSLVGLPCGEANKKMLATKPTVYGDETSPLQSEPFLCSLDCRVGIRVKQGLAVDSILVATASAHDRGRILAAVTPWINPATQRSCSDEPVLEVSSVAKHIDWPLRAAFYFVAEVRFQDGTTWRADDKFVPTALAAWMLQPKRGR